jgi:hypothetical protein
MVPNENPSSACAKPVHYQVAVNTTDLSKEEIENFTYQQCYAYFGFGGPIKTPASAMYAKKIAYYAYDNKFSDKNLNQTPNDALQNCLHFL